MNNIFILAEAVLKETPWRKIICALNPGLLDVGVRARVSLLKMVTSFVCNEDADKAQVFLAL